MTEWNKLTYQQRLAIAKHIFEAITLCPCSFRRLIYQRLGFKGDAYSVLYQAGGMLITNAVHGELNGICNDDTQVP